MSEIICPRCHDPILGSNSETSRNWYCRGCNHFDARECLKCQTREGFPVPIPWVTEAEAKLAGHDDHCTVILKSYVYCEWDLHNAYLVEKHHATRTSTCRLCETTWNSLGPATHREGLVQTVVM